MIHKTSIWGQTVRMAMVGLAVGTAVWLGLLLYGASQSRQHAAGSRTVTFGPLVLHTVTLQRDAAVTRAGITLEPGLAWYAGIWAAAGGGTGWLRSRTKRVQD